MAPLTDAKANPPQRRAGVGKIRDHRDLRVWRKSNKLAELCRAAVANVGESHGALAHTISRLADEVPDEIAAGQAGASHAEYMHHLEQARNAARHLERSLITAHRSGCLAAEVGDPLLARLAEVDRMLRKLMVSLELAQARKKSRGRTEAADVG